MEVKLGGRGEAGGLARYDEVKYDVAKGKELVRVGAIGLSWSCSVGRRRRISLKGYFVVEARF